MPRLKTETIGAGDQTWLASVHGITECRTQTVNLYFLNSASH